MKDREFLLDHTDGLKPESEDMSMVILLPLGDEDPALQVDTEVHMKYRVAFNMAINILSILADIDALDKELVHTELHDLGIV
jgi:hypothetical protein